MEETVEDTGETVAVAAEPEAVADQQSQPEQAQEMVPLSALQAIRQEKQQLAEQNRLMQDHMALMQANQQQSSRKESEFDGLTDDDVLTVGEAKKFLNQYQQQTQSSVEELRVQQKYPDYNEVVTKFLPDVIKENPALRNTLQNDPNRYELAYYLAKNSNSYRGAKSEVKKSADAQRILENGKRAGNLSSVGSTAPQSQVSSFRNMSDADFMKLANKNRGYC